MSAIQSLIESDRETTATFGDESKEYIELIEQAAAEMEAMRLALKEAVRLLSVHEFDSPDDIVAIESIEAVLKGGSE